MNDISPITQLEDSVLPEGLQRHVMDLRALSWNYEPCRNRYVDELTSRGDGVDEDSSSSNDDLEETKGDFGSRKFDNSCIQGNEELLQRYRENLHSFAKTSHLLEIVSTPNMYRDISQMVTELSLAQVSLTQEPYVSENMQESVNEEKPRQDKEGDDGWKNDQKETEAHRTEDENSVISKKESSYIKNFQDLKSNNPDEISIGHCYTMKRHAEYVDDTLARQTAPVVTSTHIDLLPQSFIGKAFDDALTSRTLEAHDERRIQGLGAEYRHILEDIVSSLNGPLQTQDLQCILRSRIAEMECNLERDFVNASFAPKGGTKWNTTSDRWYCGDADRSYIPNGKRDDTPLVIGKEESNYEEGVLKNGWLNKDLFETLTGHKECLSVEESETPSKNSRKFKPLKYWWMP